jgi:hypothetical protein
MLSHFRAFERIGPLRVDAFIFQEYYSSIENDAGSHQTMTWLDDVRHSNSSAGTSEDEAECIISPDVHGSWQFGISLDVYFLGSWPSKKEKETSRPVIIKHSKRSIFGFLSQIKVSSEIPQFLFSLSRYKNRWLLLSYPFSQELQYCNWPPSINVGLSRHMNSHFAVGWVNPLYNIILNLLNIILNTTKIFWILPKYYFGLSKRFLDLPKRETKT